MNTIKKFLKPFTKIATGAVVYGLGMIGINTCTNVAGVFAAFGLSILGIMYAATGWIDFCHNYFQSNSNFTQISGV